MVQITVAQCAILKAVAELSDAKGYPPTLRELCRYTGLASVSTPSKHLDTLRAAGLVTWEYGALRTLRLTAGGRQHLENRQGSE